MKFLCVPFSLALLLVVSGPARGQELTMLRNELRSDLADFRGGQFTSVASPRLGQTDLRRDLSDFRPTANSAAGTQPIFQRLQDLGQSQFGGFDPSQLRQRLDDLRSNFAPSQAGQSFSPSQFRDRDDRWRRDDRWDGRRGDDDRGWHHDHDYDRDHHHAWHHDHDHDGWHHGDHHDWDDRHHGWRDDYSRHHDRDWDHRRHDDNHWAHHDGDRDHHDWRRDHDRSEWARHDNGKHTGWDPDHHKASWQDNGWRARGFTSPPGQQRGGWEDRPRGGMTTAKFNDSKPHASGNNPGWSGGGSRKGSGGGKSKGR